MSPPPQLTVFMLTNAFDEDCTELFDVGQELSAASKKIHKDVRSITDRLSSIWLDALFVQIVIKSFHLPVAVNERCGRWYVPGYLDPTSVYFKSTDGHTDHCKFSLRRLNLHILPLLKELGGLIVVDSTRRGKRMPDALSKTIPIWCSVINRATAAMLSKPWTEDQLALQVPFQIVSRTEAHQIGQQVSAWVQTLLDTGIDAEVLASLDKPIRPIWITPESYLSSDPRRFDSSDFYPLILVTASRCVPDGVERLRGFNYVQGAADDEEMWSQGLNSATFWSAPDEYIAIDANQLHQEPLRFDDIPRSAQATQIDKDYHLVRVRETSVFLANRVHARDLKQFKIIDLSINAQLPLDQSGYKHYPVSDGKRGAGELHKTFALVESYLSTLDLVTEQIVITDDESCKSKAATVALLLIAVYYDDSDVLVKRHTTINKSILRNKLVTLVNSRVGLNPARAALKSLNEYLMSAAYRSKDNAIKDTPQ